MSANVCHHQTVKTNLKSELLSELGGYACSPNDNRSVGREGDWCSAILMSDQ